MIDLDYTTAVETLLNADSVRIVLLVLLALAVFFLLIGQVVKTWRDLIKPKNKSDDYKKHLHDSNARFQEDERDIEKNRRDISDLRDGLRANCRASLALLNHAINDGNTDEMEKAKDGLTDYLVSRN